MTMKALVLNSGIGKKDGYSGQRSSKVYDPNIFE